MSEIKELKRERTLIKKEIQNSEGGFFPSELLVYMKIGTSFLTLIVGAISLLTVSAIGIALITRKILIFILLGLIGLIIISIIIYSIGKKAYLKHKLKKIELKIDEIEKKTEPNKVQNGK